MKKLMLFFLGTLVIDSHCMHRIRLKSVPRTLIASWRTLQYPPLQPFHNKFMCNAGAPIITFRKKESLNKIFCPLGFAAPCISTCAFCDVDGIPPEND